MPVAEPPKKTVRGVLADFIRDVYEREDEISTDKIVRLSEKHFASDEWLNKALVREALVMIVPEVANSVRNSLRSNGHHNGQSATERLAHVFAHIGDDRHASLLAMTRPQHIFAAEEREQRAQTEIRWADFHRSIAALHKDDVCTTSECLNEKQLDSLWSKYFESE